GDVSEPTAPLGLLDVRGDGQSVHESRIGLAVHLSGRVRRVARQHGVSVASVCHVAWARVVAGLSSRSDVVFGTVLFGRMHAGEGAERVPGLFINTLPVRVQVGLQTVAESVRGMHEQLVQLLHHEHASLGIAQRCSGVAAPQPLFSALLNYRYSQGLEPVGVQDGLRAWEGIEILSAQERTNYPCVVSVDDLGEGFALTGQAVAPLQAQRLCKWMQEVLEDLVGALEAEVHRPVCGLDLLLRDEREQVLRQWNGTQESYPSQWCVHELFEQQVQRTPGAVAVVYEGRTLTYAELDGRANKLARYLCERGVGTNRLVGLCAQRSLEMVVGILGILKSGGAYVPLDPGYPPERLRYLLTDSAPVVVLRDVASAGVLDEQELREWGIELIELQPLHRLPQQDGLQDGDELADRDELAKRLWSDCARGRLDRAATGVDEHALAYVI